MIRLCAASLCVIVAASACDGGVRAGAADTASDVTADTVPPTVYDPAPWHPCDPSETVYGDLRITSDALEPLAGARCLIGSLILTGHTTDVVDEALVLDELALVWGDITVRNLPFARFDMPALTTVSGSFTLGGNAPPLAYLSGFSALEFVGGDLTLERLALVEDIAGFAALESVGGDVRIRSMYRLTEITGLGALRAIDGDLELSQNNFLAELPGLASLAYVGGTLRARRNRITTFEGLGALAVIGGSIEVLDDGVVDFSGLTSLKALGGGVRVITAPLQSFAGLERLTSIAALFVESAYDLVAFSGLEGLEQIRSGLSLQRLNQLTSLDGLEQLERIGGEIVLAHCPRLASIAALRGVVSSSLSGLRLDSLSALEDLAGLDAVTAIRGDLAISRLPVASLAGLDGLRVLDGALSLSNLSHLVDVDALTALTTRPHTVGLYNLEALTYTAPLAPRSSPRDVEIHNLASLRDAGLMVGVTDVAQTVYFRDLPALSDLSAMSSLQNIGATLIIERSGMTSLQGLEALTTVGRVVVLDNGALATVDGLQNLTTATEVFLGRLPRLTSLEGLAGLTTVTNGADFRSLAALESASGLRNLQSCGSLLSFRDNPRLTTLGIDALTQLGNGNSLSFIDNPALPTCLIEGLRAQLTSAGWTGVSVVEQSREDCSCHPDPSAPGGLHATCP